MPKVASAIIEMVVFKYEKDTPQYLLMHRQKNEKLYPNIWQIISGSIEKGEHAVSAALRELKEETGLQPRAFWIVPYVTQFYDAEHDSMNLCPVFAAQVEPGAVPVLSEEHDDFQWLPFDKAIKLPVWHGQKEAVRIVHEYLVSGSEAMRLNAIEL